MDSHQGRRPAGSRPNGIAASSESASEENAGQPLPKATASEPSSSATARVGSTPERRDEDEAERLRAAIRQALAVLEDAAG
jgi:hypothetical protein